VRSATPDFLRDRSGQWDGAAWPRPGACPEATEDGLLIVPFAASTSELDSRGRDEMATAPPTPLRFEDDVRGLAMTWMAGGWGQVAEPTVDGRRLTADR